MKILVVDDFDTMHKIIRDILIELGYEDILQAYNGEGALYHHEQREDRPDNFRLEHAQDDRP